MKNKKPTMTEFTKILKFSHRKICSKINSNSNSSRSAGKVNIRTFVINERSKLLSTSAESPQNIINCEPHTSTSSQYRTRESTKSRRRWRLSHLITPSRRRSISALQRNLKTALQGRHNMIKWDYANV